MHKLRGNFLIRFAADPQFLFFGIGVATKESRFLNGLLNCLTENVILLQTVTKIIMAPISPGFQLAPSRKAKKQTASTNLHRFEPFTKRIARLKIDPVHTVERRQPLDDDSGLLQSFFRAALEEAAELNLSQTFTSFLNKASLLCENLPQLLYHANTIFELLVEHIGRKDELALEPLLGLLAHLAHDLGQGFESYFSRTVELVAEIAATHDMAEVVEWCFTCLAWLFKYLSKRLVQDLRPLLNIMMPYLSSKKDYIVRFSAESLAFLLRKAAVLYEKNKDPLTLALEHLLGALPLKNDTLRYSPNQLGVMSLCVESARGIDGQMHSCSCSLIRCLLNSALPLSEQPHVRSVVEGVLIGLIHETTGETFRAVLEVILQFSRQLAVSVKVDQMSFSIRLLAVITGTRKGSRISEWSEVIKTVHVLADNTGKVDGEAPQFNLGFATIIADILQFAPMDQLLPYSQRLLDFAAARFSTREFFAFSTLCAELGNHRFTVLVLPHLQQYISKHWSDADISLSYMLERLRQDGFSIGGATTTRSISYPADYESIAIEYLSTMGKVIDTSTVQQLAGKLRLAKIIRLPQHSENTTRALEGYRALLVGALSDASNDRDLRQRIILGWGFDSYLDIVPNAEPGLQELSSLVLQTSLVHFSTPSFLYAAIRLLQKSSPKQRSYARTANAVRNILVQNLLATSTSLKKASLELLSLLEVSNSRDWFTESNGVMLDILGTPYTPAEARRIAMLLRRLPPLQRSLPADSSYQDLLPFFCLGLLSSYHDKTRKELCTVLAQLVESTVVEESVLNVTMQWLQTPMYSTQPPLKVEEQASQYLSSFQCSSLAQLDSLSSLVWDDFQSSDERFLTLIECAHSVETLRTPENGRLLVIQLLSTIPTLVERRSRLFVPVFLAAPFSRGRQSANPDSDTSVSSTTLSPDIDDHEWSLTERKALLSLLGKFSNPRVLFRSAEVHDKLIDLLGNGNDDTRKLALQAILTWKDPGVSRYEATLLQLAEGKLAASDISAFLNSDGEGTHIESADRENLLPIVLRLVFGTVVGRAGTPGSQDARRKSIIRALFRLSPQEVSSFLNIALGKLRDVKVGGMSSQLSGIDHLVVPEDQQYGFLRLLLSMLETLQSQFAGYGQQVVDAVVSCAIKASRQVKSPAQPSSTGALSRSIRRTGFQCLILLFEHCGDIDWPLYLPALFAEAISPRLDIFASETNHGISGLIRLFAVWAQSHDQIDFIGKYDCRAPAILWRSLAAQPTPNEVKLFILEHIALPWTELAENDSISPNKAQELLETESDGILRSLVSVLQQRPAKEILAAATAVLPKVACLAKSAESRRLTVLLLSSLLGNNALKIPPNIKGQLLQSLQSFLTVETPLDQALHQELLELVSSLFNYFKDDSNRQILCETLQRLSASNETLARVAQLCKDMNATSSQHLDMVDYDRRLRAFAAIRMLDVDELSQTCLPIIYNLLFFVRTSEDFTVRSNALGALKQIIIKSCSANDLRLDALMISSVLPVTKKCMRHESELVRADFVAVLGLLVQYVHEGETLANMTPLLVGNDEEASFFSNILHIQQHRRLRAIRRLVAEVEKGAISIDNMVDIFIPLLEMFIYDASSDESAQSIKGQSITAMGSLLQWLDWKHFKSLFRKYRSEITVTDNDKKAANRLLGHAADALMSAHTDRLEATIKKDNGVISRLASTIPSNEAVAHEVRTYFIPRLAELIHYKDETETSTRLPLAVVAVKLIRLLPQDEQAYTASPIVFDLANILRSRAQETRDAARRALCEIVLILGPACLRFVVKEMRTALTRGYQLHVVSYTLHAILVALFSHIEHGELDYCAEDLVPVIMDDIYGMVGQEKDNQDYISSMKEVKSSKSFDSMELLARSINIASVSKLVAPLQALLSGWLTTKQVRQTDELLRRIGSGISQNPSASKRDILTFAYQVIKVLYEQKSNSGTLLLTNDEKNRQRYLIQLSSASKATGSQSSALLYKLARFALDLVRSTLQRYTDICTAENVQGFLPVLGDALLEGQEDVKISAMRLLSAIIKLPMQELEENASLYFSEAVKVVKTSTNTNEEGAQAALKLVASILRDRKNLSFRDSEIALLLHRVTPDIEEPDRQGVTFNFIRAVMARKIQIPEIYELADKVGMMMVTNHSKGARDSARGVFVHFLLGYPQSSSRWSKQQKFLIKNLEYEYPEGRQSVMEAINTLIGKMKGDAAQELISALFLPILLRMINDDNEACRQLAGALLGRLFSLADRNRLNEIFLPLSTWAEQAGNDALRRVSMQAYGILLDADVSLRRGELGQIRDSLSKALMASNATDNDEWELQFQVLMLLEKLTSSHPETVLDRKQSHLWSSVWSSLRHSNSWIQSTSTNLCIQFFSHCVAADRAKLPLTCDYGLSVDAEIFLTILKASVRILRRTQGNINLSIQVQQMLLFLGQCLSGNGLLMQIAQKSADGENSESNSEEGSELGEPKKETTKIPAMQYLLDQLTRILRIEPSRLSSAALLPKKSSLQLLLNLIPTLSMVDLAKPQTDKILLPLQHLTDPNINPPQSADPTFAATYQTLIELAHEVMDKLQKKLGDTEYVMALTAVSKIMRERREERRTKRRIERVAEPEKAARGKEEES